MHVIPVADPRPWEGEALFASEVRLPRLMQAVLDALPEEGMTFAVLPDDWHCHILVARRHGGVTEAGVQLPSAPGAALYSNPTFRLMVTDGTPEDALRIVRMLEEGRNAPAPAGCREEVLAMRPMTRVYDPVHRLNGNAYLARIVPEFLRLAAGETHALLRAEAVFMHCEEILLNITSQGVEWGVMHACGKFFSHLWKSVEDLAAQGPEALIAELRALDEYAYMNTD